MNDIIMQSVLRMRGIDNSVERVIYWLTIKVNWESK
jgi:hypothetical protein